MSSPFLENPSLKKLGFLFLLERRVRLTARFVAFFRNTSVSELVEPSVFKRWCCKICVEKESKEFVKFDELLVRVRDGSENPLLPLFTSSVRQKARVATKIGSV